MVKITLITIFFSCHLLGQKNPETNSFFIRFNRFIQPVEDDYNEYSFRYDTTSCGMIAYFDYVNNLIYIRDTLNRRMFSMNTIKTKRASNKGAFLEFKVEESKSKYEAKVQVDVYAEIFFYTTSSPETSFRLISSVKD
jgi:hypothetical protein